MSQRVLAAYDTELTTIEGSVTLNNMKLAPEPIRRFIKELSENRVAEIDITSLDHDILLYGAIAMNFIDIQSYSF